MRNTHILCLQELRSEPIAVERASRKFGRDLAIYTSAGVREQAGGVTVMVRTSALPNSRIHARTVVPGRAISVDIYMEGCVIRVLNVHNFGLDADDSRRVASVVEQCMVKDPDAIGVVAGDFNIP